MTQSYMHTFVIALNANIFVVIYIRIFNINNKIHARGEVDAVEVMVTSRSITLVNHELWANARLPPLCNADRQVGLSYVNLHTYNSSNA
jgi:hypothetical protein